MKNKPLLIVVSGRPGAGKTTLARLLAKRICCPMLSRDEIKQGFCITQNAAHCELPSNTNATISSFYFDLLHTFVKQGISLVTEAAFQQTLWQPQLDALQAKCELRIIRCVISPELAQARMLKRGLENARRERYHRDFSGSAEGGSEGDSEESIREFIPVNINAPTLDVDTSLATQVNSVYSPSFEDIVSFSVNDKLIY